VQKIDFDVYNWILNVQPHNLKGHERNNSGEKFFACKICGKIHNEEKPFPCRLCDKTFEDNATANFDPPSKKFLNQSDTKELLIINQTREQEQNRPRTRGHENNLLLVAVGFMKKREWNRKLYCK
jgi:hypothetical protein